MKARGVFVVAVLFAAISASLGNAAEPAEATLTIIMTGNVGPYRVGMNITSRHHNEFQKGHYYYARRPIDIPLMGRVDGENIVLEEPSGGTFQLHFVTNMATKDRPLDFYNSIGLEGTWTQKGKVLPVKFRFDADFGDMPARLYGDVTSETDAVFESRVQKFLGGLINNRPEETAASGTWPITVHIQHKKPFTIRNKSDLLAHWAEIDTPSFVERAKLAVPHEMFVHDGAAMVVNSDIWFGPGRGAVLSILD
jgi:hypothetical protein